MLVEWCMIIGRTSSVPRLFNDALLSSQGSVTEKHQLAVIQENANSEGSRMDAAWRLKTDVQCSMKADLDHAP